MLKTEIADTPVSKSFLYSCRFWHIVYEKLKEERKYHYDVVFSGRIGEKCKTYDIVNIVRYDERRKPIGKRSLLFKREPGFVTPGFATYAEVRKFWNYPDNAKLEVRVKQTYDVVEM